MVAKEKSDKVRTRTVSTRFSEMTLEKVRIQAAHENRTICNMVAVMVERYLEMMDQFSFENRT